MKKLVFALICLLPVLTSQAKTITVDDDGPADFNHILEAIDSSQHGDTIVVKAGTYEQRISFNGKAVTLTSEDPNDPNVVKATIIAVNPNSGYSVSFDFEEGNDSVLAGFTITGRGILCYGTSPTISKNIIRDCSNYGIHGEDNAAPVISGNTISSNIWQGIYYCNGPITNNIVSENKGGIAYCHGPITNNIISNNSFNLGGALSFCQGQITGNLIADNYAFSKGGACYSCTGDIVNNIITGNRSSIAGGGLCLCYGIIENNIITGNISGSGGGVFGCSRVYNNTIVGNIANESGGGLGQCPGYISNNIIAFNRAISVGGIYGDSISSYNTLHANEGGNFGGGTTMGVGDIIADPCFASDPNWDHNETPDDKSDDFWVDGDYHVKSEAGRWSPMDRSWVKDTITSPCVDTGDPNFNWTEELWPHGKHINRGAYGGTTQASMSPLSDEGNVADLNPEVDDADDWVDYSDMILLINEWLSEVGDMPLAEDLNRDGLVDFTDFAALVDNWHPPLPPPIWEMEPHATSTRTIAMSVVVAVPSGESVEYYFDSNSPGGHDSGWQDEPNYTDTGLDPNTEYNYRVKARNKATLVETAYSDWRSARTPPDLEPPGPDPATWATEPYAISPASIRMEAMIASDDSGVEYYFDCTSHPTYSSGWQDSPIYEITSLPGLPELPKDLYSFVVRVRDKAPSRNTTGDSTEVTVDLRPPSPNPATWATEPYAIPPASVGMVATTASDNSGVEYFFECTSHPVYSSAWQDSPVYQADSLPKGLYSFVVRVRDKSPTRNTTGDSTETTIDLTPPTPDPMQWAPGGQPRKVYRGGTHIDYWAEMTAAVATDAGGGPVEYFFECTTEHDFSSGWQSDPTYDVQIGGQHVLASFRVKARDQFGNETGVSSTVTALF
ncbi:MAG: NosD domain-containing protein [Planctomycetota bacterium]